MRWKSEVKVERCAVGGTENGSGPLLSGGEVSEGTRGPAPGPLVPGFKRRSKICCGCGSERGLRPVVTRVLTPRRRLGVFTI